MAGNFISVVYATLKENKIETKDMDVSEAIEKYKELQLTLGHENNENYKYEEYEKVANETFKKELKPNSPSLEEQVDSVLNGTYKDSHIMLCKETPQIFQNVGVPNKPLLITSKHAYLAINSVGKYIGEQDNYHNLGKQKFLEIVQLLKRPILAFQNNINKNDIVAIVNVTDNLNNLVIVPIRINGKGNKNLIEIDANIAKSMYGKNNIQSFIDKYVTNENILFIQNKKIRNLQE